MKRILLPLVMVLAGGSAFAAIDSVKYPGTPDENYEFKSLDSNTSEKEQFLSLYKDSTVIFMRDSKVFTGVIDTTETEIKNIKEDKALEDLGIHGTVAYDAKNSKIYFSLEDEYGNDRLYESTIDGSSYSKPVKLVVEGFEVVKPERGRSHFLANAGWNYVGKSEIPTIEMLNPFFSEKCGRIYFTSSNIENGKGGKDIWYIEPKGDGTWKAPVNAGEAVNTDSDEDFAFIENEAQIYFSSNRDGNYNIFTAKFDCGKTGEASKLDTVYNTPSYDANIVVKDQTPFLISDRGGNQDIWAWVLLPIIEEEEPVIPELEPIVITFPWAFYLFDFDKYELTERFLREIDAMVEVMNQLPPETRFVVEGHTDQRGSDKYNDKLSLERANTVRDKLLEKGIAPDRVIAVGWGKQRPVIADPQNEEEFYQNRRVVVDILTDEATQIRKK